MAKAKRTEMSPMAFRKAFAAIAFLAVTLMQAHAQDAADAKFYVGKRIHLIVLSPPGGGFDAYSRMVAPYLGKYLDANVIVENKPGAGGIVAMNAVWVAKPDDLYLIISKVSASAMAQITSEPGVQYDISQYGYVGGLGPALDSLLVGPNSQFASVADLMKTRDVIRWAATGPMDGMSDGASMTCEGVKLKCKVILGYQGGAIAVLAMQR